MKNIKTAEEILSGRFNTTPELLDHAAHCRISSCLLAMEEHANQFKPEWVSVSQKPDENVHHVLAYDDDGDIGLFYVHDSWFVDVESMGILYWMLLPKAPNVK